MKTSGSAKVLALFLGALCGASQSPAATLRVASASPVAAQSNPYNTLPTALGQVPAAILDPLLRLGPDGQLEPVLALSWQSTSPTTWEFKLRHNVVFSDGEPFTAEAVKFTIDFLKSPAAATLLIANEVRGIAKVEAPDPHTIVITTAQPDAVLPRRLSIVYIVPPGAFTSRGLDGFSRAPVGTGPYLLKEWGDVRGKTVIETNPTSWIQPRQIDRVEVFNLLDPLSRVQALTSDQVDIAFAVNHDDLDPLRELGFNVAVKQEPQVMALAFRSADVPGHPLADVRVRRALNYAVDKDSIVRTIFHGEAQAVGQGAIAGTFGFNPEIRPYPYDPARAKALLAEAGYGDGFELEARVVTGQYVGDTTVYQQVAADLASVGVRLMLRPVLPQDWMRIYTVGEWGTTDMISFSWQSAVYGDTIRAIEPLSCRRPARFFCAEEIEPLLDASNANLDPSSRERQLQEIMARLHDLAPTIFLVNLTTVIASSPRVTEIVATRSGFRFERMTVAK